MPLSPYVLPLALPILQHVSCSPVPSLQLPSVNPLPFSLIGYMFSAMLCHPFVLLVPERFPIPLCVSPLYAADFHVLGPRPPRTWCVCHTSVRVRVRFRVRVRVGLGLGLGKGEGSQLFIVRFYLITHFFVSVPNDVRPSLGTEKKNVLLNKNVQ